METRAMAIAFFYAVGTGVGGIVGPLLFGRLVQTGKASNVATGYLIGAALMILAGLVEIALGVEAAQKSLEDIAEPLSAEDAKREEAGDREAAGEGAPAAEPVGAGVAGGTRGGGPAVQPGRAARHARGPRATWAPYQQASSYQADDPDLEPEVDRVARAVEEHGPVERRDLAVRAGARSWGPGRFGLALREAVRQGRIAEVRRNVYGPPPERRR
jgi:hypothetical protein